MPWVIRLIGVSVLLAAFVAALAMIAVSEDWGRGEVTGHPY